MKDNCNLKTLKSHSLQAMLHSWNAFDDAKAGLTAAARPQGLGQEQEHEPISAETPPRPSQMTELATNDNLRMNPRLIDLSLMLPNAMTEYMAPTS